jgi:hypothetical protein
VRWESRELLASKRPRRDKYSGAIPCCLTTPCIVLIWLAWFTGDPYGWLGLTFNLLVFSLVLFVASSLWDLGIRLASHPSRSGRAAIPRVVGPFVVWNSLPVLGWLLTYLFWVACVASV